MPPSGGLFASVKALLSTLLGTAHTRLELLINELEEERLRMIKLLFYSLLMLFFFFLGVLLLTLLVIAMFWDTNRLLTIALVTVTYLGIATWLATYVVRQAKHKPRLFSVSLAELAKDHAAFESAPFEPSP